jgi:hypothetical protein
VIPEKIEFLAATHSAARSYIPDTYQFRRDRGWVWLQRLALWALRKIGAQAFRDDQTVVRHTIDTRKFLDALVRQRAEIMALYHRRGERLLVGYEEFREITGIAMENPLTFAVQYDWREPGGPTLVYGMRVTVIPWMRGILVLPKEL